MVRCRHASQKYARREATSLYQCNPAFSRFGEAKEIVDAALFLASPMASYIHQLRLECERRILYRLRIIGWGRLFLSLSMVLLRPFLEISDPRQSYRVSSLFRQAHQGHKQKHMLGCPTANQSLPRGPGLPFSQRNQKIPNRV
jgi:hypothetical protein